MGGLELIFVACAALGVGLFALRTVLFFLGGLGEGDADSPGDVGDGGDAGDVDVGDAGDIDLAEGAEAVASFKLLTLQGITAFFAMFGLIGLALLKANAGEPVSVLGGVAAGGASAFLIGKLLASLLKLQSAGNIDFHNAIGEEGTVYLRIPADGRGKAQVTIQDRLRVVEAVSEDKEELKTGERIKVVRVVGGDTLSVTKER
jgi:membrane protein implicated in regulation of membrane protease activity